MTSTTLTARRHPRKLQHVAAARCTPPAPPVKCLSCDVRDGRHGYPGGVLRSSPDVFVNHHGPTGEDQTGWVLVCPTWHVTRMWELTLGDRCPV